jgi:hypothetical protein
LMACLASGVDAAFFLTVRHCRQGLCGIVCGMARNDPEFRLRLPEHLKAEIEKIAKFNNRSINAEIVARLASSIEMDVAGIEERVGHFEEKLEQLSKALQELGDRFDKFECEANPGRFERD